MNDWLGRCPDLACAPRPLGASTLLFHSDTVDALTCPILAARNSIMTTVHCIAVQGDSAALQRDSFALIVIVVHSIGGGLTLSDYDLDDHMPLSAKP